MHELFRKLARYISLAIGTPTAFVVAVLVCLGWAATGPMFRYSDTWQLIINTSTTVITFLVVFLLQRSQNKDSKAIHVKLNEIVAVLEGASNRLIDVEDLTEDELQTLHRHFQKLSEMAQRESSLSESHSIEEAEERHQVKTAVRTSPNPSPRAGKRA